MVTAALFGFLFFSAAHLVRVCLCGAVPVLGFALCFLLFSVHSAFSFLFLSSSLPAEKTKDILSLDSSPSLLTVPDPFIPLPLSDTPGNPSWGEKGAESCPLFGPLDRLLLFRHT